MPAYKVLIPLDGSRLAEHSLIYLDALKSLGESDVLLLSVVDQPEAFKYPSPAEAIEREVNLLGTYLREVSSDIEQHLGISVETKVATGAPAECVLEEARDYSPDLLVISTHGRSGPSRWRFGSVADKVIRGAECNLLVIGPKAAEAAKWLEARIMAPFRALLIPLDGSGLAEKALPVAAAFAESYGSAIHIVQVVSLSTVTNGLGGGPSYDPSLIQDLVDGAKVYLGEIAGRLNRQDVTTDVLVGAAGIQLHDYVEGKGIDLVVMTSHGRGGILRTALGSVTDRMLGGQAPVLVVKPKE